MCRVIMSDCMSCNMSDCVSCNYVCHVIMSDCMSCNMSDCVSCNYVCHVIMSDCLCNHVYYISKGGGDKLYPRGRAKVPLHHPRNNPRIK